MIGKIYRIEKTISFGKENLKIYSDYFYSKKIIPYKIFHNSFNYCVEHYYDKNIDNNFLLFKKHFCYNEKDNKFELNKNFRLCSPTFNKRDKEIFIQYKPLKYNLEDFKIDELLSKLSLSNLIRLVEDFKKDIL